ncbi:fungal-specific transcription factor domain-containing protein [Peziza echinospora]|nr:fungal-specific transcription factor domain-containing protein [Peziza echinospora]
MSIRHLLPKQVWDEEDTSAPGQSGGAAAEGQASAFRTPAFRASSESSSTSAEQNPPKPKRVVVSNACVPCRKRRSKCDGNSPCGKCTALNRVAECNFDAENDHRRKGALRRENDDLKRKNHHLDQIIKSIANSDDSGLQEIIKRIRRGERFEDIANGIRPPKCSPATGSRHLQSPSESDPDSGDRDRDESPPMARAPNPSSWTDVTNDDEFVLELIELFFAWHHPFFLLFSESRFRADFASGNRANCSPLLVNAILATACHYSSRPEAKQDPLDEDSTGEHFSKEAKRLLEDGNGRHPPLTKIQALPIMAIRESGAGRDLIGLTYLSMAYRLIRDENHNPLLNPVQKANDDVDAEAWIITFWGCYCLETAWSFGMGKTNLANPAANYMPKPTPTDESELTPFYPFTGKVPISQMQPAGPRMTYKIMNQHIALCEIIQDITAWLYGQKPFKAGTLLDFHARLQQWQKALPEELKELNDKSVPGLFNIHEYHSIVVLALFRPFYQLPFEPAKNFLSPREIANLAAREAVRVLRLHQKSHGLSFRYANGMIYQFLIPMCNARKLEFPLPDARDDYMWGVHCLKEAGDAWPFGKIALLSMVEIQDIPIEAKKPTPEISDLLEQFEKLSVDKKTELTQSSDYYATIVENNAGHLASDFVFHWRHAWTEYIAGLAGSKTTVRGIVKKPSVESLLN